MTLIHTPKRIVDPQCWILMLSLMITMGLNCWQKLIWNVNISLLIENSSGKISSLTFHLQVMRKTSLLGATEQVISLYNFEIDYWTFHDCDRITSAWQPDDTLVESKIIIKAEHERWEKDELKMSQNVLKHVFSDFITIYKYGKCGKMHISLLCYLA